MFADLALKQPTERTVLLYVHGGLNNNDGTITRASNYTGPLQGAGYYPIFINWQSSLVVSYRSHLFDLHQGRYTEDVPHKLAAPVVLGADLGRAATRAPIVWATMIASDLEGKVGLRELTRESDKIFCDYRKGYEAGRPGPSISRGTDALTLPEKIESLVKYVATFPTKLLSAPVIDAAGVESWSIMLRNAELLFRRDDTCSDDCRSKRASATCLEDCETQTEGGLAIFFRRLEYEINRRDNENVHWHITLMGHSAGTIIMNRILRTTSIPFDNIIFMGAACSIEDYEMSVFPYMKRHPQTQMYHLLLHRTAELRDKWDTFPRIVDLPPRGTLLVWIDDFLAKPVTLRQRTAGRYVNFVRTLPDTPSELMPRLHVKVFGVGATHEKTDPQGHGDFAKPDASGKPLYPFWAEEFWTPTGPDQLDPCDRE